jgi:hypothetical protein
MKIKKGFVVRTIAGKNVVVALGAASRDFGGMIELNETAKFIWDKLAAGAEKEEIVEALAKEYDAPRELLVSDVDNFIAKLKGVNVLE